ncbi:MAG: hypothetical protein WDO13_16265 [Verrucomicrobiota bacterium]
MRIFYLPEAEAEFERKLTRLSQRPYTTHSVSDFLEDIARLEKEILQHPGLRPVPGAPPGFFRVGPSAIHSYRLIYRLREGDAYVVAVAAPQRRPFYWKRRKL